MNYYGSSYDPKLSLSSAIATVHKDPFWWRKILLYGACALSFVGLPLAVGFVLDSMDNSRKGYPTPLPPWSDWTIRFLAGIFALLIDFVFYVFPLLVGGLLLVCVSLGLLVAAGSSNTLLSPVATAVGGLCLGLVLLMFLSGASPVGRLRFIRNGEIEEALNLDVLRWAFSAPARSFFIRARLLSLVAYLPAGLLAGAAIMLSRVQFAGQFAILCVLALLIMSAVIYAQLVGVQLYIAAEKAIQRAS